MIAAKLHQNDGRLTGWCNRCGGPCYNYVHPAAAHRCPPKESPETVRLLQAAHDFVNAAQRLATASLGTLHNQQCKQRCADAQAGLEAAAGAHARICGGPAPEESSR